MGSSSADTSINTFSQCNLELSYDRYGRMNYNPKFHKNNGKPWSREDIQYLTDWYEKVGPEEISFALERTLKTIQSKAYYLRKQGLMKKKRPYTEKIKKETLERVQK